MSTKKFFFIMIGIFMLSIAIGVTGYVMTSKVLKKRSQNLSVLMAERDVLQYKITTLRKSSSSLNDLERLNNLVESVLPKQKKQEDIIGDLIYTASGEAGISNNKIKNITFTSSQLPDSLSGTTALKEVQGVYTYPFQIQVSDITYVSLLKFLSELEQNKRFIQVDNLQITPDKSQANQIDSVNLSLKTYIRP